MQTRTTRRLLSVALAAMLAMGTAASAFADGGGSASGEIDAGGASVTETDAGNFSFTTTALTATDTTSAMALVTTITDLRGTGDGWTLSMHMTQFTCSTAETCSTTKLPKTTLLNVAAACATNSTCMLPNSSSTCSVSSNHSVSDVTSDFNICDATTGGMGSVVVTPTLTIPIAADSYIGTYTSTVTITIVDGGD